MRPLWTTKYQPRSIMTPYGLWGLMNIPLTAYYAQMSVPELKYCILDVQMNDPSDTATMEKIVHQL